MKHRGSKCKGLGMVLLVAALVVVLAVSVSAEDHGEIVDSGKCGDNLTWTLYEDGLLEISGTGEMWDFEMVEDDYYGYLCEHTTAPWHVLFSSLKLNSGLTSIGNHAFYKGGYSISGNLIIPDTVITIGEGAFEECSWSAEAGGRELTLPDSLTTIGSNAFKHCTGFTGNLTIPDSVTEIGEGAFYGCNCFNGYLVIGSGVKSIENGTFAYCNGFKGDLVIPDSVYGIDDFAFWNCTGFDGKLTLGQNLRYIDGFSGCSGLSGELIIPENVVFIAPGAFEGCSGFSDAVKITGDVKYIGAWAFSECTGIHSAYFYKDAPIVFGFSAWASAGITGEWWEVYEDGLRPESVFEYLPEDFTIYYKNDKSGWSTPEWNGYPCYPVDSIPGEEICISVTDVTLDKKSAALELQVQSDGTEKGDELTLTATIKPENATDKNVTWEISDPSVLSIKGLGESIAEAQFIAKAPGTATVTVQTIDGGFTDTCTVTVMRKEIEPTDPTLVEADIDITMYDFDNSKLYFDVTIPGNIEVGDGIILMCNAMTDNVIIEHSMSDLSVRTEYDSVNNETNVGFEIDNILNYIEWYFTYKGELFVTEDTNVRIDCSTLNKSHTYMGMFDRLNFANVSSRFHKTYYLDASDELYLKNNVSSKDWENIEKTKKGSWGGSCQGFAAVALYNANKELLPTNIRSGCKSLWEITNWNNRTESILNTYFLQQKTKAFETAKMAITFNNLTGKIVGLLSQAANDLSPTSPVLIGISKADGSSQHALLGYAAESGVYKDVGSGDSKSTYHNRILIYDCNSPSVIMYLYFDIGSNKWYYDGVRTNVVMLTFRDDLIDPLDYTEYLRSGKTTSPKPDADLSINYITVRPQNSLVLDYNLSIDGEVIRVSPGLTIPEKGIATSFLMATAYDVEGNELPPQEMTLYLPDDSHEYTVIPDEGEYCDFSLMSNDAFTYIEADHAGEIFFKDDGFIEVSNVKGKYLLSVTVDDISDVYPWNTTKVTGNGSGNRVGMEITDKGILLNGDKLNDITVSVKRDDVTDEIEICAEVETVLITAKTDGDTESIVAMIDSDNDGDFETELDSNTTYLPGDVNNDGTVDSNDAIYLLRHTMNEARYPISQSGDMNSDGEIDSNDAIYLLRHTMNPTRYPLGE